MSFDPQSWGTGADWFGTVLGGAALIIALRTFQLDHADRREEAKRQRERQARRIGFEVGTILEGPWSGVGQPKWTHEPYATVGNYSDASIRNVQVTLRVRGGPRYVETWPAIHPGQSVALQNTVRRGSEHTDHPPISERELTFVDADGNAWRTDGLTRLEQILGPAQVFNPQASTE